MAQLVHSEKKTHAGYEFLSAERKVSTDDRDVLTP
jgi:hypothetical protein